MPKYIPTPRLAVLIENSLTPQPPLIDATAESLQCANYGKQRSMTESGGCFKKGEKMRIKFYKTLSIVAVMTMIVASVAAQSKRCTSFGGAILTDLGVPDASSTMG